MKLIAIVAIDTNWAIGKDGDLLAHIPEDMKFFRETTTGHVIIMGRKTLESFPGGKPLKNRINIVLTRDKDYTVDGAIIAHSKEELSNLIADYDSEEIFIVGGGSVYKMLIDECDTALVTKIDKAYDDPDTFFPNLDEDDSWVIVRKTKEKEYEGIKYVFTQYERIK